MIECIEQRDHRIPLRTACQALGVARATVYRHRRGPARRPANPRPPSPRRIPDDERSKVLDVLHSERFCDQPVREVYATLLDEGTYLASQRTMYRLLAERGESKERRDQRVAKRYEVPRLKASAPNETWTWDITKLATFVPGVFLNLYVVLDLYSRYAVAWMIAGRENSALAKQLFAESIMRYGLCAAKLKVHSDRGAPMTAVGFGDLLAELGADRSLSRPRVSNDNPFSESQFKTVKSQPDYPGRFRDIAHARRWCADFFAWYNDNHRHSGLALFTPADVFFGRVDELAEVRQTALDAAYERTPERFVRGRPLVARPPAEVYINPIDPDEPLTTAEHLLANPHLLQSKTPRAFAASTTLITLPGAGAPDLLPT